MNRSARLSQSNLRPPEIRHGDESEFRASWSRATLHINDEHRTIADATRALPGELSPAACEKLYEAAHASGSVILQLHGVGPRGTVIALRAACAAHRDAGSPPPQCYSVLGSTAEA